MANQPLISVFTCFLNEERFLKGAIESVLQQQYQHWELFLVDDGSTDKSTEIAKSYARQYPGKIFYCEHEGHANKGLSASRNRALQQASGEYVALLDADDHWQPDLLSHLLFTMQQHPVSMVCEASRYWYSWNDPEAEDTIVRIGTEEDKVYIPPQLLVNLYPLGEGAAPCPCAILLKTEILKKYGGFNEAFSVYEDQAFLSKFYLHENVYISSGCHNQYRQREGSLVSDSHVSGKYHQERRRFLEWLEAYLEGRGINNKEVEKLLRRALLQYRQPFLYLLTQKVLSKGKYFLQKVLQKTP